jgi:hypothetical protein
MNKQRGGAFKVGGWLAIVMMAIIAGLGYGTVQLIH